MNEMNLADVLEGYAMATPEGNNPAVLQKWTTAYPQFAGDLTDFAAARAVLEHSPAELTEAEETRYRELGLKNLRAALRNAAAESAPLASLTERAKEKGLNKAKLAAAVGVSLSLLMYLEKKRLDFASIPKMLVEKIAGVLDTAEETVSAYLAKGPDALAEASFYKTATRPEEIKPKTFADAVREDQILSTEEKRKLLEMK
ncbi:MAG: hypothetical protein JSS81_22800 [Acidobacteria bacterium]|nr:hypothetical protein [Acidobacteriota bacterium]